MWKMHQKNRSHITTIKATAASRIKIQSSTATADTACASPTNSRSRLEIDGPLQNARGQGLQTHRKEWPRRDTGTPDHWRTSVRAARHQLLVQGIGGSPTISNRLTT